MDKKNIFLVDSVESAPLRNLHSIAHSFQAHRLTLARDLKEMTKQELANAVGVSTSAISQIETGKIVPEPRHLGQMAMALGVSVDFFSRKMNSQILSLESCHFRSLRSATQKQRKRILAAGTLLYDILAYCENYIEFPEDKVTPFVRQINSTEEIEVFSMKMRENWGLGLGPIPEIIKLLEGRGILVTMMPYTYHEVNAFSTWVKNRPFMFLVNKGSASEVRFDAGHELFHLLAHADAKPGDRQLEKEADAFSGCFLLPRDVFYHECPRTINWKHFSELKQRWGVSYRTLVMRGYQLGKLSEFQMRRAFVELNQNNISKFNEPYEPLMEYPALLKRLISAVEDELSLEELARGLGLTLSIFTDLVDPKF